MIDFNKYNIKRIISLAIALCTCFAIFSVYLPEKTTSFASADPISELEDKLQEYQKKQEELDKKIESTKDDADKEKENQAAITEKIGVVQNTMATLDTMMDKLSESISELQESISKKESDIADTEVEIDTNIELLKKRLRALYLSGNDSIVAILLESEDFYDVLMKSELIKRVAKHDSELITGLINMKNEYEDTLKALKNEKQDLDDKKADLISQQNAWTKQLQELNRLYSQSKDAIAELENMKNYYENQKDEYIKLEEETEKEIQRLIEEARREEEYVGGAFLWPVKGFYYVSSYYGTRWDKLHKGIDIAGSGIYNQPILASNAGKVIAVVNYCNHNWAKSTSCGCGGGYGRYCIVDHGGGYTTLYAHAGNLVVRVGDYVQRGQILGYVGSTGFSTGWHLHYEIRENGFPKDPAEYFNFI